MAKQNATHLSHPILQISLNPIMADSKVYYLTQMACTRLSHEVSSNRQDLRRTLGHANILEHLTVELINREF
jgi:hypothetical protein